MTFPTDELLNRIADILVRDTAPDKRDEERASWLELIQPKPDSSPEQHREWVAHIVRDVSVDFGFGAIRELDEAGPMSMEELDKLGASMAARFDEWERLEAEILDVDISVIKQIHGWGD